MKICVISSNVFPVGPGAGSGDQGTPGYAGLEIIAYQTAKGLAAKGHEVTLIAPDGSSCPGCDVFHTGPPGRWDEHQPFKGFKYKTDSGQEKTVPAYWPKLLEYNNGGVVLDHSWQKWPYTLKSEGALKCPVLGIMHAPVSTMYNSLPPGVEKPCFVCISKDQASHFNALHSPAEARVCYNGIDLDLYKPMSVKRTQRYLFLARFSTIKGPHLALEACNACDAELDLIGDTSITNEPQLYERCKQMADGVRRRIVGAVPRGETVWWYSKARALLHPTKHFREPFGLAPVESQACGCPVMAWDYGAMRETILPGETGFLVKSVDQMTTLIRANAVNSLNRQHCRDWASKFSVQRMVDCYEELCIEALDTGGW